jgi:hypothetical protein
MSGIYNFNDHIMLVADYQNPKPLSRPLRGSTTAVHRCIYFNYSIIHGEVYV